MEWEMMPRANPRTYARTPPRPHVPTTLRPYVPTSATTMTFIIYPDFQLSNFVAQEKQTLCFTIN